MAEVAAIALTGNILQFLEVGFKLIRTARRAYKSTSGLIEEDEEFLANTQRIQTLVGLIDQQSASEETQQALIDSSLLKTAKACDGYASELTNLLDSLRIRPGERKAWEVMRTMMLRQIKNTAIQVLEGKLANARQTLILALTTASHSRQSSALAVISELKKQNAALEANTTAKLESIEFLIRNTKPNVKPNEITVAEAARIIIPRLDELASEAQHVKKHHDFLRSLLFQKIKQRHSAIQDRHKATFEWVFTEKQTGFCEWLESGSGFFWVKGKAGSGKSTLMKYIATHDTTQSKLQTWGGERRVITASHFFWNAGNSIQKSLTGLFQTILYQVLKACPELIDVVSTARQQSGSVLAEPWDIVELRSAFQELSIQNSLPLKFCFFIDGLDEYTAGGQRYTGTFEELLLPLRELASSGSIKICVSSRPWDAFDKEFSKTKWKMQLEDLTREDIRSYVKEELGADPRFRELSQKDPRCSRIPDTIVQRAQGVFLWVYLVVNSLRRGLLNDDNYSDLQQRLNELPGDLQKYFEHMLQSIETIYWDKTTRIFRTVIAAQQSLPLLGFDFLDQEMDDPGYATTMRTRPLSNEEIGEICPRLNTRLNARCRDLLYVTDNIGETGIFRYQVDFLHRTVRDFFLDTGVIDEIIQQRPTRSFDPNLSLCKIMLGLNKIMAIDETTSQVYNQLFILADSLMYYARIVEETHTKLEQDGKGDQNREALTEVFGILDELDRSNSERLGHLGLHWTNRKDPPNDSFQEWRKKTFLAATIQARLSMYVEDRLRKNPSELRLKGGRPLLDYALRPMMITPLKINDLEQGPVLPIVKLLLDLKADPNAGIYIYDGKTPWELFLKACYQHAEAHLESENIIDDLGATIQLMISHGARSHGSFQVSESISGEITEIITRIGLPSYHVNQIRELIKIRGQEPSFFSRILGWGF